MKSGHSATAHYQTSSPKKDDKGLAILHQPLSQLELGCQDHYQKSYEAQSI